MAEQVGRRPYLRQVSRTRWFFRHPRYMRYMAREVTCIFIGAYTILLIIGLAALANGRDAYESFAQGLQTPVSVVLHAVALVFALYHSFTWFNLAPKALPIQLGERFLPNAVITAAHYLGWIALSVLILRLAGMV